MNIIKYIVILLVFVFVVGFFYFAFTDLPIEQSTITQDVTLSPSESE